MSNWTEGFTAKNDSMLSIFDKIVMRKLINSRFQFGQKLENEDFSSSSSSVNSNIIIITVPL